MRARRWLDWDALLSRADLLRARTALHVILALAVELLGAPVPDLVVRHGRPGAAKRWILELTCGTRALFRRVADDDVKQQPHLAYRIAEQDGAAQMVRSASAALMRKPAKWRYGQGGAASGLDRSVPD